MNNLLLILMLLGCQNESCDNHHHCDCDSPTMKPADCGCHKETAYDCGKCHNDCESVFERNYDFDCNCNKHHDNEDLYQSDCSCQQNRECHCKNCQHSCNCDYDKDDRNCDCNCGR